MNMYFRLLQIPISRVLYLMWVQQGCPCLVGFCTDCQDLRNQGNMVSGLYHIKVDPGDSRLVYCDMDVVGTVILRRTKGAATGVNVFDADRQKYQAGFGSASGDMWYGLDNLAQDTFLNSGGHTYTLLVRLTGHDDIVYDASYSGFQVASATYEYQLIVTGFLGGSAGNALLDTPDTSAANMKFSTRESWHDYDNDRYGHCAVRHDGGWWYNACSDSCLTCPWTPPGEPYAMTCPSGLCLGWRTLGDMTFKKVEMIMIRN